MKGWTAGVGGIKKVGAAVVGGVRSGMGKVRSLKPTQKVVGGSVVAAGVVAAAVALFGTPDSAALDGMRHAVLGKPTLAELQAKVQASPDDADLRIDLGHALFEAGKRRQALAEYDRAIRAKPSTASARVVDHVMSSFTQPEERSAAEEIISAHKLVTAEEQLRQLTHHWSHYVRAAALRSLGRLGKMDKEDFFRVHIADLEVKDCPIRDNAVKRLAELGDPRAVPAIKKARQKDIDQTPWYSFTCLRGNADKAVEQLAKK